MSRPIGRPPHSEGLITNEGGEFNLDGSNNVVIQPGPYRLEVSRTSTGKYSVSVRVTANHKDEIIDEVLGILDETKARLGIVD